MSWLSKQFNFGIDKTKIKKDPDFNIDYYPFFYKGLRVEQNNNIFHALNETYKAGIQPSRIIELGFRHGGFTAILDDHFLSENASIYAYDIDTNTVCGLSDKVHLRHKDIFKSVSEIKDLILCDGVTMVFCDGGDKNLEFQIFSNFLKKGDMILSHDYAPDIITWRNEYLGTKWDWFESWDGELEESCEKNDLVSFLPDVWNDAVWCSKIKL